MAATLLNDAPPRPARPEAAYGLTEARHFYPGSPPCVASMTRHITRGVRLKDGRTSVKLRAIRTPRGWAVSREAVAEFLGRLTADRTGGGVAS